MPLFHHKKSALPPVTSLPSGRPAAMLPLPPLPPQHAQPAGFPEDESDDLELPITGTRGRPHFRLPPAPARPQPKPLPLDTVREKLSDDFQSGLASGRGYPPIFIKIDRYRELVEEIERLKTSAVSLRDAVDALSEMSRELNSGITITQRALDKFNQVVSGIDAKMLKTGGPSTGEHPISAAEIDAYVKNLYSQVENLKKDLKTVE